MTQAMSMTKAMAMTPLTMLMLMQLT